MAARLADVSRGVRADEAILSSGYVQILSFTIFTKIRTCLQILVQSSLRDFMAALLVLIQHHMSAHRHSEANGRFLANSSPYCKLRDFMVTNSDNEADRSKNVW